MRRQLSFVACLLLLRVFSAAGSDELSGIWTGTLTQGTGGCYPQYSLELQLSASDDRITGNAYDFYDKEHFVRMSFTGRYNPQTHRIVLIEHVILQASIPEDCAPCIKTYDLIYSKKNGEEWLTGDWKGIMSDRHLPCPPGKVALRKSDHSDFPVDIPQSDTLASLQKDLRLMARPTSLAKTIAVNTPHIKIELYDNGEIDHDTVTVLVNGKLLLYRQMLTDRPLTLTLDAIPHTVYELVMYADNLGEIPPNTALMMVTAGSRKIEVFLSSSEEKSAAVRLTYEPE